MPGNNELNDSSALEALHLSGGHHGVIINPAKKTIGVVMNDQLINQVKVKYSQIKC